MLDIALLTLAIALALLTLWLASFIEYREQELYLVTSLAPELRFDSDLRVPTRKEIFLKGFKEWSLSVLFMIVFLGSVGLFIYLLLRRSSESQMVATFVSGVVVLLLSFLLPIGLRKRRKSSSNTFPSSSTKKKIVNYVGAGSLPKKVYEGDSKNFFISLHPVFEPVTSNSAPLKFQVSKDGLSISLQIVMNDKAKEFLEFELIGAGFKIEGERKQKQHLSSTILLYHWNCFFPNSGSHDFAIAIRLLSSTDCIDIGRIESTIKVVKLDHMTQRQIWILATIGGVFSGVLALAEMLHRLGAW